MPSRLVRVRFAPSPTGYLHIGGLRTALYCYLYVRQAGGQLVLRIEDTDRSRLVADAETDILSSLNWAGLSLDESPRAGGPYAPYRQSERKALYHEHARRLIDSGHAYYAFDTPEALRTLRDRGQAYDATNRLQMQNSLAMSARDVQVRLGSGEAHTVRLRVPENASISFKDEIKGPVEIPSSSLDDQILVKSDGMPTYHLANVVDDHLMAITHVIRGDEWLPSTPKHVLLYQAFGWQIPVMVHLPLILSPSGGKLSKRNAKKTGIPVAVRDYRAAGFEPEALINFLALLGWNPGSDEEVFSLPELVKAFSLKRVGVSPARFDMDKLIWFNGQHLRRMSPSDVLDRARPALDEAGFAADEAYLLAVVRLVHSRMNRADELARVYDYFFTDPESYDATGVRKRWKPDSRDLVLEYSDRVAALPSLDEAALERELRSLAEVADVGAGRLIHPVRLAISGTTAGPSLFAMLEVLGRDVIVRRLRAAAAALG